MQETPMLIGSGRSRFSIGTIDLDALVLLSKEKPPNIPLAFPQPGAVMSQRNAFPCAREDRKKRPLSLR
jgi:hypothetical protein